MGFKPTISVFEPAKAVHALDLAATVIGIVSIYREKCVTVFWFYVTLVPSDLLYSHKFNLGLYFTGARGSVVG
jgi:hypothetical protein